MRFQVKALDRQGVIAIHGVDASTSIEAAEAITRQGMAVVSVTSLSPLMALFKPKQKFRLKLFSQELLALLESGLSIVETIEVLSEKERNAGVKNVLDSMLSRLREGVPLSRAMENLPDTFPPLYIASIRASEKTSDLDEALRRYIAYQNQVDDLRSKIVSASIYPVLLMGVGSLIIVFLLAFVVPRFSKIYEDLHGDLPWMSRVMLEWGRFAEHYGLLAGGVCIALLMLGFHYFQRSGVKEYVGQLMWRSPAVGERLKVFHLSRCYRTAGMLLRGGIPFTAALTMVADLLAPALRPSLKLAIQQISEGQPASHALEAHGLTTPVALRLIRVGEQTGNMGEMMERIAAFHDEEMARWVEMVSRLFGPVLMLIIGLMIGVIVVLLYLPIFQIAESIG